MALSEVITGNPKLSLAGIAFIATLFSTLVHAWMTNQEHMKNLKARQKELQKELRKEMKHSKNSKRFQELQAETLKITMTMMKSSFRPLFITLIPLLVLFGWLRGAYVDILPSWLWWYIGFSVLFSIIIRKVLKIN